MRLQIQTVLLVVGVAAVAQAAPVIRWDFGVEETSRIQAVGGVHRDVPGPQPPEFPDFETGNTAVKFDGHGARYEFADPGPRSAFDFENGDALTLEAWVRVDEARPNENVYLIGKGRTWAKDFPRDNQNWALRLRERDGQLHVSFLFATPRASGAANTDSQWHRWTTKEGFAIGTGWHHLAATYQFGEPDSVRGWIDGKSLPGAWDMGGPTKSAPVVDDDAIWIGSSMAGSAGNSLRGYLDSVAIHREVLADDVLRSRFRRTGGPVVVKPAAEVVPDLGAIPPGKVLVTLHEGLPAHNRWLNENEQIGAEVLRWQTDHFLLPRLPLRYDAWGIRDSWKAPVLARVAADVRLAAGTNQLVLRARGLSRLWVDGQIVARTKAIAGTADGHQPVKPILPPPLPGLRSAGYEMQEIVCEVPAPSDGRCRIILEALVGGKSFRAEPGELTIAVRSPDGETFYLLQPADAGSPPVPLTNEAVGRERRRSEDALAAFDDAVRRSLAAQQDAFWNKRHALARDWARSQPPIAVPSGERHPIDAFVQDKIDKALAAAALTSHEEALEFRDKVLPILSTNCFRCHGDKETGGLRLNSREAALKAGDSELPAVVPGDPARSHLIDRIDSQNAEERMPPTGSGLKPQEIATLKAWIQKGAPWPAPPVTQQQMARSPVIGDAAFLRRAYFDTVGVPPTESEAKAFLDDASSDKRERLIDRLLGDERFADQWVSYWQDVLAENPSILKPSLNNSGPFRWYLHEALRDGKALDRVVTDLVLLKGSEREGGAAGFGLAADNDAPFAAKGHVLSTAFLGIELQCARCHDSPYHSTKQKDLYSLAAMLERKTVTVPASSTVPAGFFEKKQRESLIKVTLQPREPVAPTWPFAETTGCADDASLDVLLMKPDDSRERLAALITAPQNVRFANVLVNRVWRRLIGAGFVEPAHDWEGHASSHPELMNWLSREFVAAQYDLRGLVRLIMTSKLYQREAHGANRTAEPALRFFSSPDPRRLAAEQVVDALYAAAGKTMDVEEITFDPDGRRPATTMISLGVPKRAWMFASLSNERDRPSLSLPRARAVADVLEAFGWTGSRQSPRTDRETDPNVLQPGVMANSTLSVWITRASNDSELARLALEASSPESLVEAIFLRFLTRRPTTEERDSFAAALAPGFDQRRVPAADVEIPRPLTPLAPVTWSNHLVSEANQIQIEAEARARSGPPVDPRLASAWREAYEDFVWSLINTREFVWLP